MSDRPRRTRLTPGTRAAIRRRMAETSEPYEVARMAVLRELREQALRDRAVEAGEDASRPEPS